MAACTSFHNLHQINSRNAIWFDYNSSLTFFSFPLILYVFKIMLYYCNFWNVNNTNYFIWNGKSQVKNCIWEMRSTE